MSEPVPCGWMKDKIRALVDSLESAADTKRVRVN